MGVKFSNVCIFLCARNVNKLSCHVNGCDFKEGHPIVSDALTLNRPRESARPMAEGEPLFVRPHVFIGPEDILQKMAADRLLESHAA